MDRRKFIQAGSVAVAISGSQAFPQSQSKSKRKRRVCLIGCGWYGKIDLFRMLQVEDVEVVSLCDVDSKMLEEAADRVAARQASGNRPQTYEDFRQMLSDVDVDIALIATPDHWHALPMIAACQKGIDVYVQKPIGIDVVECKAMLAAARKYNRVVQVGMQRRSTPHLIDAKKQIVDAGLLGDVGLAEVNCYYHMRAKTNPPDLPAPPHLNYDLWTGPAPMRPYNDLVHPRRWRAFMEYSNGIVGDMCVHMLDTVRWMLELGWPSRVASTGGIFVETESKANTTDTQSAAFDFDDLRVQWQHRSYGHPADPEYPWGATLYGSKGTLRLSVHKWEFKPVNKREKTISKDAVYELEQYPEDKIEKDLERHVAPAVRGHMKNFLHCVDTRERPVSDIEEGHISATSCILANLAMKLGRTLHWDPDTNRVINDEEANQLLTRDYRKPWIHPDPSNI